MSHNRQKKIALINDFCGFGRCSVTVSLPVISALKVQCCPLPTSVFSNHTGFESYFCSDYTKYMEAYMEEWSKLDLKFDGILTGFLNSPKQTEIVESFLQRFKRENTIAVVDPVMGDDGKLYSTYTERLAKRMSSLLPYADILTPNLTEACILTGTRYRNDMSSEEIRQLCEKLRLLGPEKIVISGLDRGTYLENVVYEAGNDIVTVTEQKIGTCRAGTGDVFSSVIAADAVNGLDLVSSVRHASSFIAKALKHTVALGIPETDGLCIEECLKEI